MMGDKTVPDEGTCSGSMGSSELLVESLAVEITGILVGFKWLMLFCAGWEHKV